MRYEVKVTLSGFGGDASTDWFTLSVKENSIFAVADRVFAQTNLYEGPAFEAVAAVADRTHTSVSVGDTVTIRMTEDGSPYSDDFGPWTLRCEELGWSSVDRYRTRQF